MKSMLPDHQVSKMVLKSLLLFTFVPISLISSIFGPITVPIGDFGWRAFSLSGLRQPTRMAMMS